VHIYGQPEAWPQLLHAVASVASEVPGWFYVFYADPEPHLRLRVPNAGSALDLAMRVERLKTSLGAAPIMFRHYEREYERYGGAAAMLAAEAVFSRSTEMSLGLLEMANGWRQTARLGLGGAACLLGLRILGLGPDELRDFADKTAQGIERIASSMDLGPRPSVPDMTSMERAAARWHDWASEVEKALSSAPALAIAYREALDRNFALAEPRLRLSVVTSQIHMTCNRLALSLWEEAALYAAIARS